MSVRSLRYSDLSLRLPKGTSALPIERDAWAFLDAAGITSALQQRAVVQLVRDLKKAQLWTKMKAIYPFVGGTATSHKWNLKDPQDSDAAFRLTFNGGWTHSSNGALPNGTNAYANTYLQPATSLSLTSAHLSFYSRTDQAAATVHEMGCSINNNELPNVNLILKYTTIAGNNIRWQFPDYNITPALAPNADSRGYYVGSRNGATSSKVYKNNVTQATATGTTTQTVLPNRNLTISAYNFFAGIAGFSSKECAFATIGDGLTDAEAKLLYECVDRYQKTLGRAV